MNARRQHENSLLEISQCERCKSKMNPIDFPFTQLPLEVQKFIRAQSLLCMVVECGKCKGIGIHLYK